MRILLIDDSRLLRAMLRRALRQSGLNMSCLAEAANGREALTMMESQSFDLVLCDYCMPEMDGRDFLEAAASRLEKMPRVVIVSAQAGPEIGELIRQPSSNGYLRKPFTVEELRLAVDMAMM